MIMNKKTSLILVFVLFFSVLNAQNKQVEKLKTLYDNGEYQNCIDKSVKVATKVTDNPMPYYYSSFSYFQLFKDATQVRKKYYLTNCLSKLNYGLLRDKDSSYINQFSSLTTEIHDSTKLYALNLWDTDKNSSNYFFKSLAKIFKDTTQQYKDIYEPPVISIVQELAFSNHQGPVNQTDIAGNKQGLWVKKYPNGVVEYEIFFKDNHPAGVYRKYYQNGKVKADMYFDEQGIQTSAILYNERGQKISMGYYYNHQKDSLWQYMYNDSIVLSEEHYTKGVKNGREVTYSLASYPNILEEKFWVNGKMDSTWSGFYQDGSPRFVATYKNGLREGLYLAFSGNQNPIIIGNYKNDLPDGIWKYWNDSTQSYIETEYVNGVPKNDAQLSEEETLIIEKMNNMKGKIEEPTQQLQDNYGNY